MRPGFLKNNWDLLITGGAGATSSTAALTGNYDVAVNALAVTAVMCTAHYLRTAFSQRAGSLFGVGILTATLAVVGTQITDFSNFPHPPAREAK